MTGRWRPSPRRAQEGRGSRAPDWNWIKRYRVIPTRSAYHVKCSPWRGRFAANPAYPGGEPSRPTASRHQRPSESTRNPRELTSRPRKNDKVVKGDSALKHGFESVLHDVL